MLIKTVGALNVPDVRKLVENDGGVLRIIFEGQQYELKPGVEFFFGGEELWNSLK